MTSERRTVRVTVSGRVQGVFFRDSCRRRAEELGVAGWVRNRTDGTVEAVFSGSADAVEAMLDWAGSGPPRAAVTDLDVESADDPGRNGFEVR